MLDLNQLNSIQQPTQSKTIINLVMGEIKRTFYLKPIPNIKINEMSRTK